MNKCLNCGKEVKNKYCNVSCQNRHQNTERSRLFILKKQGELKKFSVKCNKCGKEFSVLEREKVFPLKDKYYCSRSCANSRIWTPRKCSIRIFFPPYERSCPVCGIKLSYISRDKQRVAEKKKTKCLSCRTKIMKEKGQFSQMGRKSAIIQGDKRRSENEIYFSELCKKSFSNVETNKPIFNGWDADVILTDKKVAVLWNGLWHFKQIKRKHSVSQVQNRDKIKLSEIIKCGYTPYVIEDMGQKDKSFVETEFSKFQKYLEGLTSQKSLVLLGQ